MSIDINSIQSLYSPNATRAISPVADQDGAATGVEGTTSAVSVDMSQPGQLWSQLQSLAQSNPTEFKAVTADIASQLKQAASSQTGQKADFLNNLAERFQSASQSGKMSDLAPPSGQPHVHGHHHHHHQQVQAASNSTQPTSADQTGNDSLAQMIQSILANALNSTSTAQT